MGSTICGTETNCPASSPCKMELKFHTDIRPVMGGSGNVFSDKISIIKVIDRADYDALGPNRPSGTLYLIRG